ncbi:MAG TPA: zf-HC2 domain-containing protein [Gemmatimonadales bacterium]|jgi:anti-sigma factor RsiW
MNAHLNENLSAYLDGELDGAALASADAHLAECGECREELEGLRRLMRRATALDDRPPEKDLWAGIARQLSTPSTADVVPIDSRRRRFAFTMPQLAAAAIALMALSAGAASLTVRHAATPTIAAGAPAVRAVSVRDSNPAGVASYDSAIRGMQSLVKSRQLDTATARVVQQSLTVIDLAIRQAREALSREPNNMYLNGQLQRTLDRKLDLLRQVATLPVAS